jgi:hypothetical protein
MAGELISNADLFIDFPAAGESSGGSILLDRVTNMKVTDERGTEIKRTIGKKRGAAGYIRKKGGGKIMLTELRHANPVVRWRRLWIDDTVFMLTAQDDAEDGVREKWFSCTVSKVDRSMDEEGNHTDEIEITYLDSEESA